MYYSKKEVIEIQTKGLKNKQGVLIKITDKMQKLAEDFADKYCEKHSKDLRNDNRKMKDRVICGILGEMAACEALGFGYNAADTSVGEWQKYKVSDLKHLGLNVGVKTSKIGNFPLLYTNTSKTEIICVLGEKGYVWVAGVATPDVVKNGCDDRYVKDPNILRENSRRGWKKSAFVDFENLKDLNILYDSGFKIPSK